MDDGGIYPGFSAALMTQIGLNDEGLAFGQQVEGDGRHRLAALPTQQTVLSFDSHQPVVRP